MIIVRAMKERARLEGEIKELKHRSQNCLSVLDGNPFEEDFNELTKSLTDRLNRLASLKNAVMKANVMHDMHKYIIELGELKHYLVYLKELDPKAGKQETRYSESQTVYLSQISVKNKVLTIEATQTKINQITDILDEFNAKTDIGEIEEIVLNLPKIKD
jgi:glutamate-1-semialdehyde aminotransferase